MSDPRDLLGLTFPELSASLQGLPGAGAAAAIYRDALVRGRFVPERHGLGARAVAAWCERFRIGMPSVVELRSEPAPRGGETAKAVLAFGGSPARRAECVRIPIGARRTSLCVSTQLGCRMGCRFCETGMSGYRGDLTAAEVVSQVVWANSVGWEPGSVVFQGMGEPLDNFDAVLKALQILHDPHGLGMAQERFTVCTVGHVPGIRQLAELGWKRLNLSLSLNAPDDALRCALMPIARRWSLAEVKSAVAAYRQRRNFQLGVHYCLIPGVNDRPEHARGVAEFCAGLGRVMVQLIPYNPGSAPIARAPTADEVAAFVTRLRGHGLAVRQRITKGRSVMAACGQLGGASGPAG
ncbi:MAG: radical SAM protein [Planctomycetes bacterium]|nr:radical SAM protein [Planctomycetota bacterium]